MELLNFIFPKNCLECQKSGAYVCHSCVTRVSKPKPTCSECNKPSIDGFTHTKCQKKYGINGLISLWKYEGIIRKAVLALKYKYAIEIIAELQKYMVAEINSNEILKANDYCLVPIPLHWYKENFRGFNQSGELGKKLAISLKWKYVPDLLVRKKFTAPQATLKKEKRLKNIKDVFEINKKYHDFLTNHGSLPILVFDDVYTTGSTLNEAVKVLKHTGAINVWGLTVAR